MGNAATDPIISTETWTLRFDDHPDIPVTVHGHHGDHGVWYYAHSAWPGLDYKLHFSGDTARCAVERLVAIGLGNVHNEESGCGLREIVAPRVGAPTTSPCGAWRVCLPQGEVIPVTVTRKPPPDAWCWTCSHPDAQAPGESALERLAVVKLAALAGWPVTAILGPQDDDLLAAGEDYQRERDELRAEVARLRAVLDGSDVPPSDEAIEAVYRDGGLCVIGSLDGGVLAANSPELAREIARRHRERPSNSWRWTAVGADARPRAWPVAPAVTP